MRANALLFSLVSLLQCNKASPTMQPTQEMAGNPKPKDDVNETKQMRRDLKALETNSKRMAYATFENYIPKNFGAEAPRWSPREAHPEK